MIPNEFNIAGGKKILVKIIDNIDNGKSFGVFNDATNIINLAKRVSIDNTWYDLSEEDMERTYLHEMFHVFQFYAGMDTDEMIAQVFSNFMYEYMHSLK